MPLKFDETAVEIFSEQSKAVLKDFRALVGTLRYLIELFPYLEVALDC